MRPDQISAKNIIHIHNKNNNLSSKTTKQQKQKYHTKRGSNRKKCKDLVGKSIDTQIHKYGNINTNTNIKRQEPTRGKRARILQANTTNPMMGRVPKT